MPLKVILRIPREVYGISQIQYVKILNRLSHYFQTGFGLTPLEENSRIVLAPRVNASEMDRELK